MEQEEQHYGTSTLFVLDMTPAMAVLKDWRSPPSTYWTFPYSDLKVGLNPHPVIANRAKFLGKDSQAGIVGEVSVSHCCIAR